MAEGLCIYKQGKDSKTVLGNRHRHTKGNNEAHVADIAHLKQNSLIIVPTVTSTASVQCIWRQISRREAPISRIGIIAPP